MHNYSVVKLVNGTTLVGDAVMAPEDILLNFPLEVYCKPVSDSTGKLVGEQIVLRPCLVMTQETDVLLDTYNVLYVNRLDVRLYQTYEEMVKTVYKNGMNYASVSKTKDDFDGIEDMEDDEIEYLKNYLHNMLNKKDDDTLH